MEDDGRQGGRPWDSGTAATAFASIGNETRLHILFALWEADERPVRFSDLRKRVGVRDPGQFRYHLRKLEDRFVRHTPAGYDITMAGVNVVWAVRSGDLSPGSSFEPFELDEACAACGAGLRCHYDDDMLFVDCPACDRVHVMTPFHPSGLARRTNEEVLAVLDRVVRAQNELIVHDICPRCFGTGSLELATDPGSLPVGLQRAFADGEPGPGEAIVVWTCSQCGLWGADEPARLLRFRPEVDAFYRDHGVDLASERPWSVGTDPDDYGMNVNGTDPLSLWFALTLDDETLWLLVEDGFATVTAARTPAGADPPWP